MSTVVFDNLEYTKASDVAKQFGYTADYIGQLCRARKVNARLVGRTWFVHIPSLQEHRKTKYKLTTTTQENSVEAVPVQGSVSTDIANKKYLRRVPAPEARVKRIIQRTDNSGTLRHISLSYEPDENSLIPRITRSPKVTLLKVGIADAEQVKVTSLAKTKVDLAPTTLPDVALSGRLTVQPIPDVEEVELSTNERVESEDSKISDKRDNDKNKTKINDATAETHRVHVKVLHTYKQEHNHPIKKKNHRQRSQNTTPVSKPSVLKVIPAENIVSDEHHAHISVIDVNESSAPSPVNIIFLVASLVFAVATSVAILTAEQVVLASQKITYSQLEFNLSNISNIASILFTVE